MSAPIQRFKRNTAGLDFAVGDIHGHFSRLQRLLDAVGFDPSRDRLFSVGDLVDRGPDCEQVIEWLDKPWFHPVRGNHDDYVCRYDTCDVGNWLINGGLWFQSLLDYQKKEFQIRFRELPIAIEVETARGTVGLVHADCPFPTWAQLVRELENPETQSKFKQVKNSCMWSRQRIHRGDESIIDDLRALVVGHTPLAYPVKTGNVYHIDTAGWKLDRGGYFTLLDLDTLHVVG